MYRGTIGAKEMAGKKILVVDDDSKTVELVRLYLNRDGYRVITANDGVTALRLAREEHPDLIVLDLMLPGIDGFEICRTLRDESGGLLQPLHRFPFGRGLLNFALCPLIICTCSWGARAGAAGARPGG